MAFLEVSIEALGPQGDGIAFGPRGRLFVERGLPGDRLRVKLKRGDGPARGEIVGVLTPSRERQAAPCAHYESCGGCSLQHLKLPTYRAWKIARVEEAFRQLGLRPQLWKSPVFASPGQRRRATFSLQRQGKTVVMGYYGRRSQVVTEIDSCLVIDPRLATLRDRLQSLLIPLVGEAEPLDVSLQWVEGKVDLLLTGPLRRAPASETLLALEPIARVAHRSHEKEPIKILATRKPVTATFGALTVSLPPGAFLQATQEGESALVAAVKAALPQSGRFADLFSGCGTFSGPLLERAAVDAYEMVPSAVSALARAAGDRPLRVFRRDLFRHPLTPSELNRYDAVVLDPPRAGAAAQVDTLARSKCGMVVAVSCNPATLARDARALVDGGFWLQSLQVVDQFLWSHHVEVVAVFTRKKHFPRRNG